MYRFGPLLPGFLQHPRDQIDCLALEIFAEMLVPSQFPALVPGQQADDIVRDPCAGQSRSREMA